MMYKTKFTVFFSEIHTKHIKALDLESSVPFRLCLGFHGRDFPDNSHLLFSAHALETFGQ